MDYHAHYDKLIARSRGRLLECYTEKHHIIPRCMGGGDEQKNLAVLTAEEHYVAHQLLVKMHPGNKSLVYATVMMGSARPNSNNKIYGWVRRKFAETQRGKIVSEETRAKMRAAHLGKSKHTPESRKKIAEARTGVPWTAAQRAARPVFEYTVDDKTWNSITECATHYGVSEPTIYGWRLKGYTKSRLQRDFTVTYDGVEYPSTAAAARAHGISKQGMAKRLVRLKSGKKPGNTPWNSGTSVQVGKKKRNTRARSVNSAK